MAAFRDNAFESECGYYWDEGLLQCTNIMSGKKNLSLGLSYDKVDSFAIVLRFSKRLEIISHAR